MTFKIREAVCSDAAQMAKVHVDSWRTTYRGILPETFLASLSYEWREQKWRKILCEQNDNGFGLVAETEAGEVVAIACGRFDSGDSEYTGELNTIYLLEAYQRQGIGKKLVVEVVKRLAAHGIYSMIVWAIADNPMRTFYEKNGGIFLREQPFLLDQIPTQEAGYGWADTKIWLES